MSQRDQAAKQISGINFLESGKDCFVPCDDVRKDCFVPHNYVKNLYM